MRSSTALGVGLAGADPAAELGGGDAIGVAPATGPALDEVPECENGLDDDGDVLVDMEDPDCVEPTDPEERPVPVEPESAPAPAPAPAPAEPTAPEPAPSEPSAKIESGSSLNAADAPGAGKVTRNRGLDGSGGGTGIGAGGAVTAPPATAGVQPADHGADGGSAAFDEGGAPTASNPTTTFAMFGPAPIGVPNFVIDSFEIPPFLLPIYQACGTEYGVPWEVLASINKIETGFGTNLNISSAGAMGWMQFLPSSWDMYGLDANGDGREDPYNPVDAICAAAHYLKAAGAGQDLYKAIFAYNHADWYVEEVLLYAHAYGKLPTDLVGSLTGLTEGAHFPVAADARYADDISTRAALKQATPGQRDEYGNAAAVISSSPTRRGINIFAARARRWSPSTTA